MVRKMLALLGIAVAVSIGNGVPGCGTNGSLVGFVGPTSAPSATGQDSDVDEENGDVNDVDDGDVNNQQVGNNVDTDDAVPTP